jgi:hypothetical protein
MPFLGASRPYVLKYCYVTSVVGQMVGYTESRVLVAELVQLTVTGVGCDLVGRIFVQLHGFTLVFATVRT